MIELSRFSRLIAAMHYAALTALAASPNGQLRKDQSCKQLSPPSRSTIGRVGYLPERPLRF